MKSGLNWTNNYSKYQSEGSTEAEGQYLDYLIDSIFQWNNGCFLLALEDTVVRIGHTGYFLANAEMKDYDVIINGHKLFVKSGIITYDNICKIVSDYGDDCTTVLLIICLIIHTLKKIGRFQFLIPIDISKQQSLAADPKVKHQISSTGNLECAENTAMLFIIEEVKELP